MICKIRKWTLADAADLAAALSNRKVQDNLRDGLPYPYTEQDGVDFISAMLSANMFLRKVIFSAFMQSHLRIIRHLVVSWKK